MKWLNRSSPLKACIVRDHVFEQAIWKQKKKKNNNNNKLSLNSSNCSIHDREPKGKYLHHVVLFI